MLSVEDLRHERENPIAAYHTFLLNDANSPRGVHAFVEGHDDPSFYNNFIRTFASDPNDVFPLYICGDKEGVHKVYRLIKGANPIGNVLFFTDKDHSDLLSEKWLNAPNIYVTDHYSVENYLVSNDMLSRVWTELFRFTKVEVAFSNVYRNKFYAALERFYEYILPLIASGIYLRRRGMRPNLKNIHFSDLFVFTEELTLEKCEKVKRIGNFKFLELTCNAKIDESDPKWQSEINKILEELSALEPKTYISGKLELGFFVKFVNELVKLLDKGISEMEDGAKVALKTPLFEDNAVEVLGPRAEIPSSLKEFLQQNMINSSFKVGKNEA